MINIEAIRTASELFSRLIHDGIYDMSVSSYSDFEIDCIVFEFRNDSGKMMDVEVCYDKLNTIIGVDRKTHDDVLEVVILIEDFLDNKI